MVLLSSSICDFGRKMPEFKLKGLDDNFFDSQIIEKYDAIFIFLKPRLFRNFNFSILKQEKKRSILF